jgi:hypothetical protein
MLTTEERQIREAFIDGYESARDDGSKSAAQAWRDENQTDGHDPDEPPPPFGYPGTDGHDPGEPPPPFGYPGWHDDLWLVLEGGARDQAHIDTVVFRLRRALALAGLRTD